MGWNDFSLPICGSQYENEDGTSRQEELALCAPGDRLELKREPDNPHDPMAVAVLTERSVCVGYLNRVRAGWIGSKIDRGYDVRAIVERVRGRSMKGVPLDVILRINMDGENPELPDSGMQTLVDQVLMRDRDSNMVPQ
ncbi:HIRAN domain-containing protein [Qipengyuania atrilutea]|uniref:HIRAN domain-containing protein n=1 Tax=Qipengyuania atrilutea TaxID=2744473 RepID=A0A850GVG9_9SPHN|nr:HIRAN domain-containing protein [Actirhodobacter atriluteus]NVD43504.1 HIRAN domain-containing protein [Actirhodobacter atriluteus]